MLKGSIEVLSGSYISLVAFVRGFITDYLSSSVKFSNTGMAHASNSNDAEYQQHRAGIRQRKVIGGCEVTNNGDSKCTYPSPSVRAGVGNAFDEPPIRLGPR